MTPQLPTGCVIAVLGAESSGKTELTGAIARRLNQRGVACVEVHEYLREWCDREGRTPRPDEQNAIAAEQTRRIADAAAQGVVLADTTALMTAIYSDMLFDDPSLYDAALATQRGYAITLVTALDLPWVADGLQRDGPQVQQPVDHLLRGALLGAGIGFSVIGGQGPQRLANARAAWAALQRSGQPRPRDAGAWRHRCGRCGDPACEQHLFSR